MKRLILLMTFILLVGCYPPTNPPVDPTVTTAITTTIHPTTTTSTTTITITTLSATGAVIAPSGADDTAAFVNAVTNNSEVTVVGPLLIGSPAVLTTSNKRIRFVGSGSLVRTTRPATRTWQVLVLRNSTNITIDNLRITGPNIEVCEFMWYPPPPYNQTQNPQWIHVGYASVYEAQHGLEISGGSNITINGGRIYGMSGDGVYIANHPDLVTINDLATECTGRSSISNVGSTRVTVNRGAFHRAGMWIFNVEPFNSNYVHDYTINDARVGYSNFYWLMASGPYFSCDIRNVTIRANLSGVGFDLPVAPYGHRINDCVRSEFRIL